MELTKRPGETDLSYHKRIIYGKLVDKTLADIDYSELSEYAYGQPYSSDVARRMFYGSEKTLQMLDRSVANGIQEPDMLSELDDKLLELQKERQRFYDQRREYNTLVRDDSRSEHLHERLVAAAEALNDSVGDLYPHGHGTLYETPDRSEAVLVFCDWHYGLKTENIWNSYNTEIAKDRVCQVVGSAIKRLQLHNCRRLHIAFLGDGVHGAIHTSARVASEELVADQLMQVSEIMAQSILELSNYVEETVVHATYGNHGRTVQNKNDSIHRDNLERIIPWWLRQRLKDQDNIVIADESPNELLFFDVCGHGFCASHGDLDGVKSSTRLLPALFQKQYGKTVECVLLADKHHRESFEELGVRSIICGALCGSDDYANDRRLYSTPEQLMLIVTPEDGVDAEYHLRCK